ncbi:MAG: type II secretion system F family protein [Planctomycetes bacterium]|nr:type II secretion system F family protein [Planctomycetota bacterium]
MPVYEYKAFNEAGQSKTGICDADTAREARERLRRDKFHVVALKQVKQAEEGSRFSVGAFFKRKKRTGELAMVTRQFATLLESGIPMAEALRALTEQIHARGLETTFRNIREKITGGASLAEALGHYPAYFDDLYVNMVKAGEAAGNVDLVLKRLSEYLLKQNQLRNKVGAALMYPMVMVGVGVTVVSVLMAFVVPKIVELVKARGEDLPLPTQILIFSSSFLRSYWYLLVLAAIALSAAFGAVRRTPGGRLAVDRFLLGMPIFGDLFTKQAVSRFATTFSTLLASGVTVLECLLIVKNVVNNAVIANVLDDVHDRIMEGADISTPIKNSKVFPPAVGYMVSVGEQSGQLEEILSRLAATYDEEIDIAVQKMTAVLEPVLILSMAVVVAFIVISILLPMLQLSNI